MKAPTPRRKSLLSLTWLLPLILLDLDLDLEEKRTVLRYHLSFGAPFRPPLPLWASKASAALPSGHSGSRLTLSFLRLVQLVTRHRRALKLQRLRAAAVSLPQVDGSLPQYHTPRHLDECAGHCPLRLDSRSRRPSSRRRLTVFGTIPCFSLYSIWRARQPPWSIPS